MDYNCLVMLAPYFGVCGGSSIDWGVVFQFGVGLFNTVVYALVCGG